MFNKYAVFYLKQTVADADEPNSTDDDITKDGAKKGPHKSDDETETSVSSAFVLKYNNI